MPAPVPAQAANPPAKQPPTVAYSDLLSLARHRQIASAVIDPQGGVARLTLHDGGKRDVVIPQDDTSLATTLSGDGVHVEIAAASHSASAFSVLLPLFGVLMIGGFILFIVSQRKGMGGGGQNRQVGENRTTQEGTSTVRFADVAGCDEAVEELRDTLDFLKNPERFEKVGATMPTGLILHGPPGTGKTLLAKALAGEAGVPFFAASGSDFVEMYVGVGAKRIRELFTKAKKSETGAVVFIDEIDAIGRRRGGPSQGGGQEVENTLNALLVELDGFAGRKNVICMAATNRVDVLDPALLRPGRFGMQVAVETPDEKGRRTILDLYAKGKPLSEDIDLDALAAFTAGSSGAQLADMMNQAAIIAARSEREEITDADLREGHLRVLAGPERQNASMRDDERQLVAWHEAGHVLSAELLETQDKAQRVTIRPRGRAAGLAVYGQTDRALHSRRYLHERMITILAGRAAEHLLVREISSGAANDLQQANMLARQAVLEFGFSDRVGQIISHDGQHHLSDETRRVVDEEVERLVADSYQDAIALLDEHRDELDRLAEALLGAGQLERVDILAVLGGEQRQHARTPRQVARSKPRHIHAVPEPVAAVERSRELSGRLVAIAHWLEQRPRRRRRMTAS
ncbi:MAG: ATP-dependent metallopeptidase FtsH/Yme1/Tma family protein [Gaiellales bacterium]